MDRYFVTGTDTDIGKTLVSASLALALRLAGRAPIILKPVQTGLTPGEEGDAQLAARLAGVPGIEFRRYAKAADPWAAALAQGEEPPSAAALAAMLAEIQGAVVVEGAGGICVPLNAREEFLDLARVAQLPTIVAVGLRLGCISHARLTARALRGAQVANLGFVLVERDGPYPEAARADVERALQGIGPILGILRFAREEAEVIAQGARLFAAWLS